MARANSTAPTATDTAPTDGQQWRLRYYVGDLEHFTEWTTSFATVENYYEQYRRDELTSDVTIERRDQIRRSVADQEERA